MAKSKPPQETALIVGAGEGLSAALARLFAKAEMRVALAARKTDKLAALCAETGARAYTCDASKRGDVDSLFAAVARDLAAPDVVVFNASYRTRGPLVELDPVEVEKSLLVTCYGCFLVGHAAAKQKLSRSSGTLLCT